MTELFDDPMMVDSLRRGASLWQGTPFHAHARVRGSGVDCVNLAIALYEQCGITLDLTLPKYHLDEGSHSEDSAVVNWLASSPRFARIGPQPGDTLCFNLGKSEHHVGVVISKTLFIHSLPGSGVVLSNLTDPTFRKRMTHIFRPIL